MQKFEKEEKQILFDIFEKSFNRECKTYSDFAYMVERYLFGNGERIVRQKDSQYHFKTNDIAGAKVISVLLNTLSKSEGKYHFTNLAASIKEVASFLADALVDTYGPAIPVNLYGKNGGSSDFAGLVSSALLEKGLSKVSTRSGLFVNYDAQSVPTVSEDDQKFLEKQYVLCKQMFVDKFALILSIYPNRERFERYMRAVEFMFSNLEARMTPKTLQKPEIANAKASVDKFLNETSHFFAGRNVRGFRSGELFQTVNDISRKLQKNAATEQEKQVFQDFVERCVTLHKALNFVGEDGKTYPANYFLVMPMSPHMFFNLLSQVQKVPGLTEEQKTLLTTVKSETRMIFPSMDTVLNGQYRDFDEAFDKRYKGVRVCNGNNTLDLNDEQTFEAFKERVKKIMDDYELSNTKICLYTVANQIAAGREPLNFGFVSQETAAQKTDKTPKTTGDGQKVK